MEGIPEVQGVNHKSVFHIEMAEASMDCKPVILGGEDSILPGGLGEVGLEVFFSQFLIRQLDDADNKNLVNSIKKVNQRIHKG